MEGGVRFQRTNAAGASGCLSEMMKEVCRSQARSDQSEAEEIWDKRPWSRQIK